MGTATIPQGFDQIEPPDIEGLLDCVHCGLCLPTCPTYLELGLEMDSPRGRLYLMRAVREGRAGISDDLVTHLSRCLGCRACETACPSGVPYGRLLEEARGQLLRHRPEEMGSGLLRAFLLGVFPHPGRLRMALTPVAMAERLGLRRWLRGTGLLRRLAPRLAEMEALLPPWPPRGRTEVPPEVTPARGTRRLRVGLLSGCIQQVLFPKVNAASVRVLAEVGCEVVVPRDQACCGALHLHAGDRARARALARRNIEAFRRAGVEAVVTNTAGCGAAMKGYGELLRDEPDLAEEAGAFSRSVQDIAQTLAAVELDGRLGPLPLTVTYHDPCHLAHGQRVRREPRALLRAIPGVTLVELRDSDLCCGSAGLYNLLQPALAGRLLARKVASIRETGAAVVASGNAGCLLQIARGLRDAGLPMRVAHPVELLDWAYRGGVPAPEAP